MVKLDDLPGVDPVAVRALSGVVIHWRMFVVAGETIGLRGMGEFDGTPAGLFMTF